MPRTVLTVDGSARTLTCVDVIPSTGTSVGVGGAGRGVSVGCGVIDGGRIAVSKAGVGEAVSVRGVFVAQLLIIHAIMVMLSEKYLKATL